MEPSRIALQRKASSDSDEDSLRLPQAPQTPVRKGKKKPPVKTYAKTNFAKVKGDALRTPPSPTGRRHSDRAPKERLRVLRDRDNDVNDKNNASEDESGTRKKHIRKKRSLRKTRSLSPMEPRKKDHRTNAKEILSWEPPAVPTVDDGGDSSTAKSTMTSVETSNNDNSISQTTTTPAEDAVDNEERSLGSLIDEIEAEFGGQPQGKQQLETTAVYHQSTSSLPAIMAMYDSSDDNHLSSDGELDADAILALAVASVAAKKSPPPPHDAVDTPKDIKPQGAAPDADNNNNASMGTMSTDTSTLSTTFEESVVDLFSNLKPLSAEDKMNSATTLRPPSGHASRGVSRRRVPGSKRRKKRDSTSTTSSDDSARLELSTPSSEINTNLSTIGEARGFPPNASGTVNSIGTDNVEQQVMEGVGGQSLSVLDTSDIMSPETKKEVLRATVHCSPLQVSKHTGLRTSNHRSSRTSSAASASYLLDRLPLEPPLGSKNQSKETTSLDIIRKSPTKKSKKRSDVTVDVSVDPSVEQFHAAEPPAPRGEESNTTTESPSDTGAVIESCAELSSKTNKKKEKDANVLATTLAMMETRKPAIPNRLPRSEETCAASVEPFSNKVPIHTIPEESPSEVSIDSSQKASAHSDPTGVIPDSADINESTEETENSESLSQLYKIPFSNTVTSLSTATPSEMSSSQPGQRRNPPARPWTGKTTVSSESLASSIKELSVSTVEEDSMLNVLISKLEKEGIGVEKKEQRQEITLAVSPAEFETEQKGIEDGADLGKIEHVKYPWSQETFTRACELLVDALGKSDSDYADISMWTLERVNIHGNSRIYLSRRYQTQINAMAAEETERAEDDYGSIYEDPDAVQIADSEISEQVWDWQLSVVHSETWQAPTLYFHVEDMHSGQPCSRSQIVDYLSQTYYQNAAEDTWEFVSQEEHPITRMPCFFLHPCRTNDRLDHLEAHDNDPAVRLLQWMSILLPSIGICISSKTFSQFMTLRQNMTNEESQVSEVSGAKNRRTASSPKSPKLPKSQQGRSSRLSKVPSVDSPNIGAVSAPPLNPSRPKTPPRKTKANVQATESGGLPEEGASPRRRIRSRRSTSGTEDTAPPPDATKPKLRTAPDGVAPKLRKKTPTKSRSEPETPSTKARRKTPTKPRVSTGDNNGNTQRRRKTPTRPRSTTEDRSSGGKGTPTRHRPTPASGAVPVRRGTPTKTRNGTNQTRLPRKERTPTRTRQTVDKEGISSGKIGTSRPDTEPARVEGSSPKAPTVARTKKVKESSSQLVSTGQTRIATSQNAVGRLPPSTLTKVRKRVIKQSGIRSSPGSNPSVEALDILHVEAPSTPSKAQTKINAEPVLQGPPHVSPDADVTDTGTNKGRAEAALTSPGSVLPSSTTAMESPRIAESPSEGSKTGSSGRNSTPTRVRKFLGAAAERIVAVCRTPPRQRDTLSLSEMTQEESEVSFSPFRRYRRLRSRTPPQERNPMGSHNIRRAAVSQSPPRQRVERTYSRSLSPVQRRSSLHTDISEVAKKGAKRPTSRGRHKNSSNEASTRRKVPASAQSSTSLSSRESAPPKTPKSRRKEIDANTDESSRTKTPTRSRRGKRTIPDPEAQAPTTPKQESAKPGIRPRRKASERSSFSSASNTEKERNEVPVVTPIQRRKTPTRGRGRTPTKRRTQNSSLQRASSERVVAPDPPGSMRGKKRSVSMNKSRRTRSQTRSQSPTAIPPQSLHHRQGKLSLAQVPIL